MKNIKYLLLVLLFIPFVVNAASGSIKSTSIVGSDTATVGSSFSQGFKVDFSGISKGTTDTYGIWIVGYELDYDSNIFAIEKVESDGNEWTSTIYKEGGKTYVLSQFTNDPWHNACVDGILLCSDYIVSIKFYVKDTTKTSTTIKMKNVEAGVFQVVGSLHPEYNTSDMIELDYSKEASVKINIKRPANVNVKDVKDNITNKPKVKTPTTSTKTTKKSNNNNLKSLTIDGYNIKFKEDRLLYEIRVKEDVKSLNVEAKSDDKKAKVTISGADDLEKSNYKVTIKVKAENGDKKTYTINVKKENEKRVRDIVIKPSKKKENKITKKQLTIGGLIVAAIFLIIILILLIRHLLDRKVDRAFDNF